MLTRLLKWRSASIKDGLYVVHHGMSNDGSFLDSSLIIPDAGETEFCKGVNYLISDERRMAGGLLDVEGIALDDLPPLDDGDIILIAPNSNRVEILFQVNSESNVLFVTNACNSRCQFCPQPSSADDGYFYEAAKKVIELVPDLGNTVNVTGGEPTIRKESFLEVIKSASSAWPNTRLFILTNGRNFSDRGFVRQLFDVRGDGPLGFGVPLYSDSAEEHDAIVRTRGAFGETIRGLYNLAMHKAEIEVRIVASRLTYRRLEKIIDYIGRNLPFVARIAIMGLEPMGYCRAHWKDFWVDPEDMAMELENAYRTGMHYALDVKLYNFQLCCIPRSLRAIACSSISEWKKNYIDECLCCSMRHACGGFFASQNKPEYLPRRFAR